MITTRTAKQCGQADFGWLQALYTFSFGHYFDPKLLGFASLRVLNQGSAGARRFLPGQNVPKSRYPEPDSGRRSEYRDSDGNHVQAKAGEAC